MKRSYIAFMLLGLILTEGCEQILELFMEKVYYIYIQNDSNIDLFVAAADGKHSISPYPDTILPNSRPFLKEVGPDERAKWESHGKWEDRINNLIPSDTLSIYLFDADTVNICGWEEVAKDYKVLKRYDLSVDDLVKMNWTVTYP